MCSTADLIDAAIAHLQDGQCQLHCNGCPRVVTGKVRQLALQINQDCPPLRQPLLSLLQLPLNALECCKVIVFAVQLIPHILRSASQTLKSAGGATKQLDRLHQEAKQQRLQVRTLAGAACSTLCSACL